MFCVIPIPKQVKIILYPPLLVCQTVHNHHVTYSIVIEFRLVSNLTADNYIFLQLGFLCRF